MSAISFGSGYKYQLQRAYVIETDVYPAHDIATTYLYLDIDGTLEIRDGYAWDGPSGPTLDTRDFMRGSLVHDALYQLLREGHLPAWQRARADHLLRVICREDGMPVIRAWLVWLAVRLFGASSARRTLREVKA